MMFIKKVGSSTTQKNTSSLRLYGFPSLREFKKILPCTFIYEPILIQKNIIADIITTQIFDLIKYDMKSLKVA